MDIAIVKDNIIVNVITIDKQDSAEKFGGVPLPEGKWIGDKYDDSLEDNSSVWDELDKAYQEGYHEGYTEGVNTAYDQ